MALTVGVNSYVTVAEAEAYLGDSIGHEVFLALPAKESTLVAAYRQITAMCGKTFPAAGSSLPVPQAIKDAQCEVASLMASSGSVSGEAGNNLTLLKAGSAQLNFGKSSSSKKSIFETPVIMGLLADYCCCAGGSAMVPMERG